MEMTLGSSFALHPNAPAHAAAQAPAADASAVPPASPGTAKPAHRFSFDDFLDIVNPLQHLPVVGTLYRKLTGDKIGTPEKIVGDGLYGGVWGLVSSVADTLFEDATGKNFGDTVLAFASDHLGLSLPSFADAKTLEPAPAQIAKAAYGAQSAPAAQAALPDIMARFATTAGGPSPSAPGAAQDAVRRTAATRSSQSAPAIVAQAATPDIAALTASLSRHGFDHDTMQRALAAYRRMSMPGYAH